MTPASTTSPRISRSRRRRSAAAILLGAGTLALVVACQPETGTCVQNLAIDVTSVVSDAYNNVVRGANGSGSWQYPCPGGGTAAITGTVNSATVSFSLDFVFSGCVHDTLTLDGMLHDTTSNGGNLATKIEDATATALHLRGSEIGCNADPIDATCMVTLHFASSGDEHDICGLTYPQ